MLSYEDLLSFRCCSFFVLVVQTVNYYAQLYYKTQNITYSYNIYISYYKYND